MVGRIGGRRARGGNFRRDGGPIWPATISIGHFPAWDRQRRSTPSSAVPWLASRRRNLLHAGGHAARRHGVIALDDAPCRCSRLRDRGWRAIRLDRKLASERPV